MHKGFEKKCRKFKFTLIKNGWAGNVGEWKYYVKGRIENSK